MLDLDTNNKSALVLTSEVITTDNDEIPYDVAARIESEPTLILKSN